MVSLTVLEVENVLGWSTEKNRRHVKYIGWGKKERYVTKRKIDRQKVRSEYRERHSDENNH